MTKVPAVQEVPAAPEAEMTETVPEEVATDLMKGAALMPPRQSEEQEVR